MPDYTDFEVVVEALGKAQDANDTLRDRVREQHDFIDKRDGQWQDDISQRFIDNKKPRFTFDKATPIVKQISGEMKKADFGIKVLPMDSGADNDLADTMNGMVRNIQAISNAKHTYNAAGKSMVTGGFDGWEVVQKYVDDNSFDQDLVIQHIPSAVDSLYLGVESLMQDGSDSMTGWKLVPLSIDEYNERYPENENRGKSVNTNRTHRRFEQKPEQIIVADFYYKTKADANLVMMTDGKVYEDNDDFNKVKDELAQRNPPITIALDDDGEEKRRKRKRFKVMHRQFDGNDWLIPAAETVFSFIPLIPTYGNFKVRDGKIIYFGAVEKLIDPCRVYNYARSRQIQEGALSPLDKIFMTPEQIGANKDKIQTMNTNNDPVQVWTHVADQPPPFKMGTSAINQGLAETAASANADVSQAAGLFAANMGDNPGLQSGVAIDALKESGDTGTIDYFESQEIAICHTARILVDAIPRAYDGARQVRILGEDNTVNMVQLNEKVRDQQTGDVVMLNDLSVGKYDVTCTVGKSFKNRQQETVAAITEVAGVDPTFLQEGADIFLSNITAPGMDLLAERKRAQLLRAGVIPEDQWTDEEREQAAQAAQTAQDQPPSPEQMIGQAELMKAQTDQKTAELKQLEAQANFEIAQKKLQQQDRKLDQSEAQLLFDRDKQRTDELTAVTLQMANITKALGLDGVITPNTINILKQQVAIVDQKQDEVEALPPQ